ncbi:ROK family protein [Desertivirga brevis]|uniref:ROK family protein n=1 Tax=Desertivirga brevis TaxID=2810310 RepID=UPI001A96E7E2|nr:ROK family protein [Pedobacter sp. SYSU D00873]
MDKLTFIGAAVEDQYISAGIVDFTERKVATNTLRRKRVDPRATSEEIINKWADCLSEVLSLNKDGEVRIGLGIPNLVDYQSGVYLDTDPNRYGSLKGQNIKKLLAGKLGLSEEDILIRNVDANFFQGEIFAGTARGYQRSFGITLGAGLGTARYRNGIVEDANYWKMPFEDSIAEDYISSGFLLKRFAKLSGIEVGDIPEMKRFYPDPSVELAFQEFAYYLGKFIVQVSTLESPEAILIGGQMESSYRFFFDHAVNFARNEGVKIPIIKAILGERAYVIGAASIWSEVLLHS